MLGESQYLGLTRDLSEGGLYICSVDRDARTRDLLGQGLQLEFALPGNRELIWAGGQVCYQERVEGVHGLGVRLTNMADRHARMLREYMDNIQRARLQNRLLRSERLRARG